jgi:hypothetical protein
MSEEGAVPPAGNPATDEGGGGRSFSLLGVSITLPVLERGPAVERRVALFARCALVVAVLLPTLGMVPELVNLTPDLNDGAFHQGVLANTVAAVREGHDPLDFWFPTWVCGFPLFQYYQPGPYYLLALLHALTLGAVSNLLLLRLVTTVAMALFPLAMYRASRSLGLPREVAAWAALAAWWINAGAYGIEANSFTWAGWGLFAQAVALPALPLAVAAGVRAVRGAKPRLGAALLLAVTLLLHILYGYIAAASVALAVLVAGSFAEARRRAGRLALLGVQVFALVAFFVVPLALNIGYHLKSKYDPAQKFDSLGAQQVLTNLASGNLFDRDRLPVLTILVIAGAYLAARAWLERRDEAAGFLVLGFVAWLLLYFGRATWGGIVDLLPFSHGLHMERLSNGVHLFGLWLAALAAGRLTRAVLSVPGKRLRAFACTAALIPAASPLAGTIGYFAFDARLDAQGRDAYAKEAPDLEPVLTALRTDPNSRVYLGHSGNWGHTYKVGPVQVYQLLSAQGINHLSNMPFSWALTNDFQQVFRTWEPSDYELFDVRWLLTDRTDVVPPRGVLVLHSGKHLLYRVPTEGPFQIVSVPLAVIGDKDTTWYVNMNWMTGPWSLERAHAQLVFAGAPLPGVPVVRMVDQFHFEGGSGRRDVFAQPGMFAPSPPPPPRGTLSAWRLSRQEASVRVALAKPGVVLFKTTYHPAWHAYMDGRRTPTVILTPGMIGVPLPAGTHELRVAYEPGWWKELLIVLGVGLAVAVHRWQLRRPALVGEAA